MTTDKKGWGLVDGNKAQEEGRRRAISGDKPQTQKVAQDFSTKLFNKKSHLEVAIWSNRQF